MDQKGTIIYFGGFEMPDKNAAAHRVLNNAKIFHELGYHVVFCGIDHDITDNAKEVCKMDPFDNIPAAYPRTTTEWVKHQIDFSHIKKVLELYDDVKYVVSYNMHAIPLFKLQIYAKQNQIKVIADVTEWYENAFSLKPTKFIRWLDTNIVMRYLTKKVDSMIAISSYLKNYYQKSVRNIIVVPPLVDLTEKIWHTDCGEKLNCLEFVYSGTVSRKNENDKIGAIIECFGKIPREKRFRFTIIGMTEKQFLEMYPELTRTLESLKGKVEFRGRVSHAESITALKRADYSIILRNRSRKNMAGFPTKFVECITCGINIIANNFSDIAKYFPKDENSFLMNDEDNSSFFDGIKKIFSLDLERIRQGRKMEYTFDYKNEVVHFCEFIN